MGLNDEENGIWTGSLRGGVEAGEVILSSARALISAAGKRGHAGASLLASAAVTLTASGEVVPVPFAPPTWIEYGGSYTGYELRTLAESHEQFSVSVWMRSDDWTPGGGAAGILIQVGNGADHPQIALAIQGGVAWYETVNDFFNEIWNYTFHEDDKWHHYGLSSAGFWIDGVLQTPTSHGQSGTVQPVVTGPVQLFVLPAVKVADLRIFSAVSAVQTQAVYGSPLLNDGATTIVGAWRMGDGPGAGTAFDRSVKALPLNVTTGMTWGGVKDTRILAVGWYCGGVFISPHTGDNWANPITSGDWGCCASDKTGQYLIAGGAIDTPGELKVSTNYGVTWVTRNPGGGDPNRDWSYGCAISGDASIMLATDTEALYKSTDHGANWTTVSSLVARPERMATNTDGSVMAVVASGGLYVSTNGGTSWTNRHIAAPTTASAYVAMSENGAVIILGYFLGFGPSVGHAEVSTDYGATWTPQSITFAAAYAVGCDADGSFLIVGGERLFTSSDGGATWIERQPAGDYDFLWMALTVNTDGKILTAFNNATKGYRSFDGGETWTEITPSGLISSGFSDAAGSRS